MLLSFLPPLSWSTFLSVSRNEEGNSWDRVPDPGIFENSCSCSGKFSFLFPLWNKPSRGMYMLLLELVWISNNGTKQYACAQCGSTAYACGSVTEMLISDATRRTRTPSQIRIDMASEFKMVGRYVSVIACLVMEDNKRNSGTSSWREWHMLPCLATNTGHLST